MIHRAQRSGAPRGPRAQGGAMAITAALWLIPLVGLAALAYDVGHLLVTRNELQNAADAAALAGANCLDKATAATGADCTSDPSPTINWAAAESRASQTIQLNKARAKALVDAQVQSGYWNVNGGNALQDKTHSPLGPCTLSSGVMITACDKPAVMVTVRMDGADNGGAVIPLVAAMFGGSPVAVAASAVAVLSSPNTAHPGSLVPQAINKCMFDLYWDSETNTPRLATSTTLNGVPQVIGQPWRLRIGSAYHYGACDSGQWTSFDVVNNSANYARELVRNGNPTLLDIGDGIYIQPGTQTSLYNDLSAMYPTPPGADVTVPVVDYPAGLGGVKSTLPIVAFAGFHITDIKGGSGKYIEGYFIPGFSAGGTSGIGPHYGAYTPARLAR